MEDLMDHTNIKTEKIYTTNAIITQCDIQIP